MRKLKKPVSILLSVILVFSLFTIVPFEVGAAATSIQYVDRTWDPETKTVVGTEETLENPPTFEEDHYTGNVTVGNGWLFVDRNITIDQTMYIDNDYHVKLIIANGCTLTVKGGIYLRDHAKFSVYGQQGDTGKLYATNEYDENLYSAIDGDDSARLNVYGATIEAIGDNRLSAGISGNVTIYGGTVNATAGSSYGAGIGGSSHDSGENITINGGEVTAIGGSDASGIGGGYEGNGGNITINGGTVKAYGGPGAAGIGGGHGGSGGNITINGGDVTAYSTSEYEGIGNGDGAGIGGGIDGNGGNITINGGTVEAISYADGAGIGGGDTSEGIGGHGGDGGNITIRGGKVTAISVEGGAGIGGGYHGNGGTINIYDGEINARCNGKDWGDGAGIGGGDGGDGGTVHIYGGKITAYADGESNEGSAIGGGLDGADGTLTIADGLWVHTGVKPDSTDWRYRQNRVSECRSSKYAYIEPCTRHTADPEPNDGNPVWSDYESDNETTHSKHCVACNVSKDTHNHDFDDPVWSWGDHYATAQATFKCKDCPYSETLDATVTREETPQHTIAAAAVVEFRGTTHTKEVTSDIPVYSYIRRSWNEETKRVEETTEYIYDFYVLETTNEKVWAANNRCEIGDDAHENTNGWYVVNSDVTLKGFISKGDNVNLLICDGAKLTCNEGLTCDVSIGGDIYHLNIFSQQNGTGEIVATGADNNAGIGGLDETSAGVITIHGGKITANGDEYAAGIGGGDNGNGGTITIYGGNVTATGGDDGAGIGGGDNYDGGKITIYGGEVTATGGKDGAGIGGGCDGSGGTVNIYGGNITATGGEDAVGIGGGYSSEGNGTLTIADGWMVRSGDNADSTDWSLRENRVKDCQTHHYAKIYPCDVHENETYGTWDKHFKSDDDATHSYTCLACNGDANIQNHNIAVSWTWVPDCSEATAHFSCEPCGFSKDVTASGDQITDEIIDREKDEHKFTATVTLAGNEYSNTFTCRSVEYIDLNGETQRAYAAIINANTNNMTNGWYAVTENVTINNRIYTNGTVNLILCDNANLNLQTKGIAVRSGNSLTIWGQSNNAGVLNASYGSSYHDGVNPDNSCAAIGADFSTGSGSITINGGTINATGANYSCTGIGGGDKGDGIITINGGIITARGGKYTAGIGGGSGSDPRHYGVDKVGYGTVIINGGKITAQGGESASAIGGGWYGTGTVTITGGEIEATSGGNAAAIGGGRLGKGDITITGGKITAHSGGIGSGWEIKYDYSDGQGPVDRFPERGSVTLDYGENGVSVYSYEYHNTDITLSKPFTDGTNIHQAGEIAEEVIKDKTIIAYDGMGVHLAGHSISLDGDIAVNFYLKLSDDVINSQNNPYMLFNVPNTSAEYQTQKVYLNEAEQKDGYYQFKCRVAAKDMSSVIKAQLIDGESKSIKYTYSVKEYADHLIKHQDDSAAFKNAVSLVKATLNYGAYAQLYFDKNTDALANAGLSDGDKKLGNVAIYIADPVIENLPEGTIYDGATLSLKSETTLSLYFNSSADLEFSCGDYKVETVTSGKYQIARIRGIKAPDINKTLTLNVNNGTVSYSPFNYCKYVLADGTQDENLKNVVKALYLYWQAAIDYFNTCEHTTTTIEENRVEATCTAEGSYDEVTYCTKCGRVMSTSHVIIPKIPHTIESAAEVPATHEADGVKAHYKCTACNGLFTDEACTTQTTAEALVIPRLNKVDLAALTGGFTLLDGDIATGTLGGDYKIMIADGATVTLRNADITCLTGEAEYAGITPLGDATILLNGTNTVKGGKNIYPGIYSAENHTLTIDGTGSLTASSNGKGCGIGGGYGMTAGNIVIQGGKITAYGGNSAAGIGSGEDGACGNITIADTVIKVTAISDLENPIGAGANGTCGDVTIAEGLTSTTGQNDNGYTTVIVPTPNTVDLAALNGNYKAKNGDVLTGKLNGHYQITVEAGATITLKDATIDCLGDSDKFASITPLGNATIILEGTNTVKGGNGYYPSIFAAQNATLTIDGDGSLTASPNDNDYSYACGIGGGYRMTAGNIVIQGGNITAISEYNSAGIGSGYKASCGDITVYGGTVNAKGGYQAAGIGSGGEGSCGNITIAGTVTRVTAKKGANDAYCQSIGAGRDGRCGTVIIEDPSKVTQN